jgi:hypothetical protein
VCLRQAHSNSTSVSDTAMTTSTKRVALAHAGQDVKAAKVGHVEAMSDMGGVRNLRVQSGCQRA